MDCEKLNQKLKEMQYTNEAVQANKHKIDMIKRKGYDSAVEGNWGRYGLSEDQRKTVNHLIASLLEQNNAELEKELKPLADLLDTQKQPDDKRLTT